MFPDPGSKNRSVKLFFSPPLPVSLFRSGGFSPALQVAPDLLFFSKIAASLSPHWQFFLSEVSIPLQFCRTQPGYTPCPDFPAGDRKSTRLNSSHVAISYAVFCLKKKR